MISAGAWERSSFRSEYSRTDVSTPVTHPTGVIIDRNGQVIPDCPVVSCASRSSVMHLVRWHTSEVRNAKGTDHHGSTHDTIGIDARAATGISLQRGSTGWAGRLRPTRWRSILEDSGTNGQGAIRDERVRRDHDPSSRRACPEALRATDRVGAGSSFAEVPEQQAAGAHGAEGEFWEGCSKNRRSGIRWGRGGRRLLEARLVVIRWGRWGVRRLQRREWRLWGIGLI